MDEKTHSRVGKTIWIPPERIHVEPDLIPDPQYSRLFSGHFMGLVDVGLTRMRIDDITPGFYLWEAGEVRHVLQFDERAVPNSVARIRRGFRPLLEIYWNPLCPKPSKWVCPDDEVSFFAYRALNIKWVPCAIYKPPAARSAHAVVVLHKDDVLTCRKCIPSRQKAYLPGLVPDEEHNQPLVLDRLMGFCAESRAALREFHLGPGGELHFHQMLDSLLRRHVTSLTVIRQLLSDGHLEQASAIVRMAYEAFLNLYVDWLSPEFIGPRMQIFSRLETRLREPKRSENARSREDLAHALGGFDGLFRSTRRKAHISPLGDMFHDITYPRLSSVVHQHYGHLEQDTVDFDSEAEPPEPELVRVLYRWIDVITTSILLIVQNEVGKPIDAPDRT